MDLTKNTNGDTCNVNMSGEFTFKDNQVFKEVVNKIGDSKIAKVLIDISGISFVDSAGLGMLLLAQDEARKNNVKLVLCSPQGQVAKVFRVSNFDTLFEIED